MLGCADPSQSDKLQLNDKSNKYLYFVCDVTFLSTEVAAEGGWHGGGRDAVQAGHGEAVIGAVTHQGGGEHHVLKCQPRVKNVYEMKIFLAALNLYLIWQISLFLFCMKCLQWPLGAG